MFGDRVNVEPAIKQRPHARLQKERVVDISFRAVLIGDSGDENPRGAFGLAGPAEFNAGERVAEKSEGNRRRRCEDVAKFVTRRAFAVPRARLAFARNAEFLAARYSRKRERERKVVGNRA